MFRPFCVYASCGRYGVMGRLEEVDCEEERRRINGENLREKVNEKEEVYSR